MRRPNVADRGCNFKARNLLSLLAAFEERRHQDVGLYHGHGEGGAF